MQHTAEKFNGHGPVTESCTEWGDIRLGSHHMYASAGLTSLQCFINDLDTGLEERLIKFANSTKL